jgi:hypothetical protein
VTPAERLADRMATSLAELHQQIDALCSLMLIEERPPIDLERRLLLVIRDGSARLSGQLFRRFSEISP